MKRMHKMTSIFMVSMLCLAYAQSVSAQAGPYDTSPTDPTACWADPAPYDGPNYRVDCDDPACDVGPCTVRECWYDPARDEPTRLAPSFTVSCSDPRCNVGPCVHTDTGGGVTGAASAGGTSGNDIEPAPDARSTGVPDSAGSAGVAPATAPEPDTLGSDAGASDVAPEQEAVQATQRNESDMEFVRRTAAARDGEANDAAPFFSRVWSFLTSWF